MLTKMNRFVLVLLVFCSLLGCSQNGPSVNKIDSQSLPSGVKHEGASSGGGGYSQQPTHQMLDIAKLSLANTVSNIPDEFFVKFPKEFSREKIVEIIKGIQFMPKERRERDGSYLKMDYDKKTNTLIATYDFYVIYNFPSVMSLILKPEKLRDAITNIQTDIMHELSHLLGIGTSLDSNFTSELFSSEFLGSIQSVRIICENEEFKMAIFPYKNIFLLEKKDANQIMESLEQQEWYDADLNEIFEDKEEALETLDNGDTFFDEFITAETSIYLADEKLDGSSYVWESGLDEIKFEKNAQYFSIDNNGKQTEYFKKGAVGFLFNSTNGDHEYISQINDKGNSSSNSEDKANYGEFTEKINTSLKFDSNFKSAVFEYDMKIEFVEPLKNEQLTYELEAKKIRGEMHLKYEFNNCVKKVDAFPLDVFLKFKISSPKDPQIEDFVNELLGW